MLLFCFQSWTKFQQAGWLRSQQHCQACRQNNRHFVRWVSREPQASGSFEQKTDKNDLCRWWAGTLPRDWFNWRCWEAKLLLQSFPHGGVCADERPNEISQHFLGARHFSGDYRLLLETPDWFFLHLDRNSPSDEELGWERQKILLALFATCACESVFKVTLLVDESDATYPNLTVLAMVSSIMEVPGLVVVTSL